MENPEVVVEPIVEPPKGGSTKRQMLRDTAFTMGTRAFMLASVLLKQIIIARALGPEGRGYYGLITNLYDLMISYGRLGVNESIIFHAGKQPNILEKYVGNVLTLAMIAGAFMLAGIAALWGVLHQTFFKGVPLVPMAIMLGMLPFGLLLAYLASVLQSQRQVMMFNLIQGIVSLTHLVAIFVALFVLDGGVLGAVLASTFSVMIPFVVTLFRVSRLTKLRPQFDLQVIKELISFGVKSHTQYVMSATIDKMDAPIMNLYLNPAAVGIYMVALTLVGRTMNLPAAISTALYPHLVASGSNERMDNITESACRNLLVMVACTSILGAIVTPFVLLLFGPEYRGAYYPFLFLLAAMIPQGAYQILNRNFASRGKPLLGAIPTGIALVVNLVLDVILIPRMGIIGGGIATLAGAVCLITTGVYLYSRLSGRPWWSVVLIQPSDIQGYLRLSRKVGQRLRLTKPVSTTP